MSVTLITKVAEILREDNTSPATRKFGKLLQDNAEGVAELCKDNELFGKMLDLIRGNIVDQRLAELLVSYSKDLIEFSKIENGVYFNELISLYYDPLTRETAELAFKSFEYDRAIESNEELSVVNDNVPARVQDRTNSNNYIAKEQLQDQRVNEPYSYVATELAREARNNQSIIAF